MSMVTLTISAAMYTQYWGPGFGIAPATFVLLLVIVLMNACGVRVNSYSILGEVVRSSVVDLCKHGMDI